MEQIVAKYLKYLNIPISQKYCQKLIASHPDYPSFLSIADTLERLGIRYRAARIAKEQLDRLPFPYLLQPDEKGEKLVFIRDQQDLAAVHQTSADDVRVPLRQGSGGQAIVLQAEPTDTIADQENDRQRSEETFFRIGSGVFGLALTGLLLLLLSVQNVPWIHALLLVTAAAGATVGYLLIARELGIQYKAVESFCGSGTKANCDAVLRSEAATLFGPVTFSDAAASYFLFQLTAVGLLIPLLEVAAPVLWALAGLSALSLPVIAYSLYYQAARVKTWCRLCLIVDGILILQAGLFGYLYANAAIGIADGGWLPAALTILLFAITGSGLVLVKNAFKRATKAEEAEVAASRIKYAPDIFLHLLQREQRVDVTPFKQEMLIGDPEAPVTIMMVASLSCGPCNEGFEKAVELVATYPGRVSLALRLYKSGRGANGISSASTYLIGYWKQYIYGKADGSARTERLVRDWFAAENIQAFMQQYLISGGKDMNGATDLAEKHYKWIDQADISRTPTFLINGWRLPKQYQIDDIMTLVPSLADYFDSQEHNIENIPLRI